MNGRAYDPNLGRFLSVDPFIQAPTNSQSMNSYSYLMNSPLAGTDPTGYVGLMAGSSGRDRMASNRKASSLGGRSGGAGGDAKGGGSKGSQGAMVASTAAGPGGIASIGSSAVPGASVRDSGSAPGAGSTAAAGDVNGPGNNNQSGSTTDSAISDTQEALASNAEDTVGNTDWAQAMEKDPIGAGYPKCNLFVNNMGDDAGIDMPSQTLPTESGPVVFPLRTRQWADPGGQSDREIAAAGFTRVEGNELQRGDIVVVRPAVGSAYGHMGIVTGIDDFTVVSARASSVVSESGSAANWASQSSDRRVVWRYTGTQSSGGGQ